MLYLRSGEISSLAAQTIQKYKEYIGVDWELFKVNPITLAEMWGLDVKFVDLGEDSDIMGFTAFNDMDITLTDANQSDITLELSGRTIVINEALTRGCAGRLNFTIAHEIAHHITIILSTSFAAPIIPSSSDCSRILRKPTTAIPSIMMSTWRISLRRRC